MTVIAGRCRRRRQPRRFIRSIAAVLGCAAFAAATAAARAQVLAEQLPGDALVYIGWAGADAATQRGYDGSHLQSVLAESRVHELFGSYLDQLQQQVVAREPDAAEPFRIVRTLGAPLWKYPTAFALLPAPDVDIQHRPPLRAILLTKAGADSSKLTDEWNDLFAKTHSSDAPHATLLGNDTVCLSIGFENGSGPAAPDAGAALSANKDFMDALERVGGAKQPLCFGYVNVEGSLKLVDQAAADATRHEGSETSTTTGAADTKAKVDAFLDSSGLRGVKRIVSTTGFDGKDWVDATFVDAPGQRSGLLTAWPDGSVDPSLMKAVPADASFFSSVRFDPAVFIRQMQTTLGKTDDNALLWFNRGLGALQQGLGTNVLNNILEPLGPDWVFFNAPHVGTASVFGTVLVNKPDDAEKLRRGLNAASVSLANWINVGFDYAHIVPPTQQGSGVGGVHAEKIKIGDANITYLTTPVFAPSWAIEDGRLYVGLYPQTVGAAVRQAKKGGPSIVDSDAYKQMVARLGVEPQTATLYNLPAVASYSQMYGSMLVIGRYVGIADLFGPPLPEPLLPPFDVLSDNLAAAGTAGWHDEAGWHSKSVQSFPGSTLLMEQGLFANLGPVTSTIVPSIVLPALNRARETANRVKSASNLRQIGLACIMYANDHKGHLPSDLGAAANEGPLRPDVFVNPRSSTPMPGDMKFDTEEAAAAYINEHSDYVYVGKGMTEGRIRTPAQTVLAYEKPDGLGDGVNILFADGHVEFVQMPDAMQKINQANKDAPGTTP